MIDGGSGPGKGHCHIISSRFYSMKSNLYWCGWHIFKLSLCSGDWDEITTTGGLYAQGQWGSQSGAAGPCPMPQQSRYDGGQRRTLGRN